MIRGDVRTTSNAVPSPRAFWQVIPNDNPATGSSPLQWLSHHFPWILGSALGVFASTILYASRNGGLKAFWHASLHLQIMSSLPLRIHPVTITAPQAINRTCAWTCQLARHVYLLALCALCQAVILPCLAGSQLLGWAGCALFGTLRVLNMALRIVFQVLFNPLVVDTGLNRAFVVILKMVTSYCRWMWDWTTDLHDAAIAFAGGSQPVSHLHLHPTDQPQEGSPKSSHWRVAPFDSPTGITRTSSHVRLIPDPPRTKLGDSIADFVVTCEADISHGGARLRLPVRTTFRLSPVLADRLNQRTIGSSGSPGNFNVDVARWSETNELRDWRGFDVHGRELGQGQSNESERDTPDGGLRNPRGEDSDKNIQDECCGNESSSPLLGHRRGRRVPELRSPSVLSPAFWCPP